MTYTPEEKTVIYEAAVKGMKGREVLDAIRGGACVRTLKGDEEEMVSSFLAPLERKGIFLVTALSADYPASLAHASDPPLLLYGMGRRELLARRKFCIVGSRITPPWAEKFGKNLSAELSEQFTIVTGLAEGGDAAAIAGALPSGNLISVLPCGIDMCYPAAHTSLKEKIIEKGLVLSEYPLGTGTAKWSFYQRNRILAGLSEGVLVLSAGVRSGALITAGCALDYGKEVFALPYNIGVSQGAGCNSLIKAGAYLVTEAADILSVYGIEAQKEKPEAQAEGDEGRVLQYLRERGETHVATIAEALGLRIFEASAALSALEIKGLATKTGGNKYSAV